MVVAVWAGTSDDEPPEPAATHHEVPGEVVSRSDQTVCVEVEPEDDDGHAGQVCGSDVHGAVNATVAVGDRVVADVNAVNGRRATGASLSGRP